MTAEEQLSHLRAVAEELRHAHAKSEQGRAICDNERERLRARAVELEGWLAEANAIRSEKATSLILAQRLLEDADALLADMVADVSPEDWRPRARTLRQRIAGVAP